MGEAAWLWYKFGMRAFRRIPREQAGAAAVHAARFLAQNPRVSLVYVFGSAADPTCAVVRDVDLAVLAEPPLSFDDILRLRADVVAATGMPIDLISLNTAPVVLAKEIADGGRCLFSRTPEADVEFVTRARARYWDFKPFLDEQWRLAGERLAERRRGTET